MEQSKKRVSPKKVLAAALAVLLVLVLAGALAHKQDLRVCGAVAKDHIGAGLRQGAAPALETLLPQGFPSIRHINDLFLSLLFTENRAKSASGKPGYSTSQGETMDAGG